MIIEKIKKIRQTKLWAITINVLLIVVVANLIVNFFPINVDLTAEKVHSLSPETRAIIANLDDLITIKAFISSNLPPQLIPGRKTLEDVLKQYQRVSRGKIKVSFLNPQENKAVQREALSLGITPLQFSSVQKDQFQMVQGYFGLAIFYAGKSQAIPILQEMENLEYQLTSEIRKIQTDELPKIGISFNPNSENQNLGGVNQVLGSVYQVTNLDLYSENADPKDEDIKTLIVVRPEGKFSLRVKLFLDQLLMNQKGILILSDQIAIDQGLRARKTDNDLGDLLGFYGIKVNGNLVADPSSSFATFRTENGSFIIPYPFWVKTRPENRSQDLPPTASLESVVFPWVSSIGIEKGAKPLWQSTANAQVTSDFSNLTPNREWDFENKDGNQQFILAAIQTNGFDSYFSQPSVKEKNELDLKDIKEKSDSVKLAVVADADFIDDQSLTSNPENAQFFMNLVDYLSQDTQLIKIRSKSISSRPLKQLEEKEKQLVRSISLATGPILLLAIAIYIRWLRKIKNQLI